MRTLGISVVLLVWLPWISNLEMLVAPGTSAWPRYQCQVSVLVPGWLGSPGQLLSDCMAETGLYVFSASECVWPYQLRSSLCKAVCVKPVVLWLVVYKLVA